MVFIGTFEESEKEVENKKTGEKRTVKGCWRVQSHVCLNGLVVADYDHLEGDVREIWATAFEKLSDEDKARIVLVYVTPSGHGLKDRQPHRQPAGLLGKAGLAARRVV